MKDFRNYLLNQNLSNNTIVAYQNAVNGYNKIFKSITKRNLLLYKTHLIENFNSRTVNLKIQAINKYLEFLGKTNLRLKLVKIQQRMFIENVISDADYNFFKEMLRKEQNLVWYFIVRFLCATGARIGELINFKVEHIKIGYVDLYAKGGKIRRIYIPKALRDEASVWLESENVKSGYIFRNRFGDRITTRGIAQQIKKFAIKYGINPDVVYPHSFRHRFAKNFINKCNDIALLADLLGHDSIETTRIYLRKTASEQQELVDEIVNW